MNCKKNNAGFTLIELIVVIVIISILSGIIIFAIGQYINKGKDSNIAGNLAILIPAGEVFYNVENTNHGDGYTGFCNPDENSALKNAILQMPDQKAGAPCFSDTMQQATNPKGVCCTVAPNGNSWAACARKFATPANYYCVDSRGIKKEIDTALYPCDDTITQCP